MKKDPRPPFRMLPSRRAVLRCDGKFVVGGRASFVWETFLLRRAAGVPGAYEVRLGQDGPWHSVAYTIAEAEAELAAGSKTFGKGRVDRARRTRAGRERRGLPVD